MIDQVLQQHSNSYTFHEFEKELANMPGVKITGSEAFGLPEPNDVDHYCGSEDYGKIVLILREKGVSIKESAYFKGVHVKLPTDETGIHGEVNVNIFCIPHEDLEHWEFATEMIRHAVQKFPVFKSAASNRQARHSMFEMLRSISKMSSAMAVQPKEVS
jgi:hypothetical protein